MNTIKQNIPTTFWYCLSLCMIVITATLCYVSIKASRITLEYQGRILAIERQFLEDDLKEFNHMVYSVSKQTERSLEASSEEESVVEQTERVNPVAIDSDVADPNIFNQRAEELLRRNKERQEWMQKEIWFK